MKEISRINQFHHNIQNYIWRVGNWMEHGVCRQISEMEVSKFMDFLDSEIIKLKRDLQNEKTRTKTNR